MEGPKISVIVTVYKAEPYLHRCIDSVVCQTYKNLEIILVDDGSPDSCGAICDDYAIRDGRIKVVHEADKGTPTARNSGLEVATGEWIGFLDSDDYMEKDQYEYLLDLACRYGADVAQCGAFVEAAGKQEIQFVPNREECLDVRCIADAKPFFSCTVWSRIYRREILNGVVFDPEYIIGDDLLFNMQVLHKANKTVFGTKAKYHYVQRPDSLCNSRPDPALLASARNAILQAEQEFIETGSESALCLCRELWLRNNLDVCSKIVRYKMKAECPDLVAEIRDEMKELCKHSFVDAQFSRKEKYKAFLIAYSWPVYKWIVLAMKRRKVPIRV